MTILIIGAAGMIGRKLAASFKGEALVLADAFLPPDQPNATSLTLDFAAEETPARLLATRPEVIFHLAAVVSGEAEADFDKGYATNLDASRRLLDAIRLMPGYKPKFVFASTAAVFGPPFPARIPDDFAPTPATSYGTQKAATELLLNDYSRRGFLDAVALRLPTICIRPGLPNRAASGFFSNILREPLVGKPAILPVRDTLRHYFASPRAAVGFFRHAMTLDTAKLGTARALNLPGLSATVADEIAALRRVAGQKAVDLIRFEPDATIARIVEGWAADYAATRARALGFTAETGFDQIIEAHLEDA